MGVLFKKFVNKQLKNVQIIEKSFGIYGEFTLSSLCGDPNFIQNRFSNAMIYICVQIQKNNNSENSDPLKLMTCQVRVAQQTVSPNSSF